MKSLIKIIIPILTLSSCINKDELMLLKQEDNPENIVTFNETINNTTTSDPYSLTNMQQAYNQLYTTGKVTSPKTLIHTHLYVEFTPATWELYDSLLLSLGDNELFDEPMVENETSLPAPDKNHQTERINTDLPGKKYAVVPKNFSFRNDITYNILNQLYFPEYDQTYNSVSDADSAMALLESKSETILTASQTTNSTDAVNTNLATYQWYPSGRIRGYDNVMEGPIPFYGVKIIARRWTKVKTAITDDNGNFYIPHSFSRPVNYSYKCERADFDIRSGTFGQVKYNGPKKIGAWNFDITNNLQNYYAHIHMAACDYYYRNIWGIGSPPIKSFFRPKLKIAAHSQSNSDDNGSTHMWTRTFGILPQIAIWNPDRLQSDVYSTTIHELGHAAHWWHNKVSYNNAESKVCESWSRGIQWVMTNYRYHRLNKLWFNDKGGWQTYNTIDNYDALKKGYTPIVIDLIDNVNQRAGHGNSLSYPPDNV